ncbi:MAG: hypothetical protein QOC81_1527 [Thermoanaerobaculia bacterium]|jgi:hypothetical protein|nr:hypothetical protein [Thermoanaerobaculia bacterium]
MIQARFFSRFIVVALVCLLLVPALSAKPGNGEPIARLSASGSLAVWTTAANSERITLTVAGPDGAIYRKEFASGTAPSFRLQDLGAKVSDGSYRYEMRFAPNVSAEVKRQLAAARAANDDVAAARIQREAGLTEELVLSGSLSVMNGAFVSTDSTEPAAPGHQPAAAATGGTTSASSISSPHTPTTLDVVTADDAIIQGSACIGLDCVNNESFGFDTVRLKENNTRIKFDDTSSSTGFPNHDWQLTANDSASGGANKFSIEDITAATVPFTVTGSAPTNSIFVDSTGRVGFRTSTPVLDLHVNTSNTPALRLEQNNSGGFTAQTFDVGGNEANFFVRDVTGGSRLPFRIRPGAPTSSIDIAASGSVGIGTASPGAKLDIGTGSSARGGFTKLLIGNGGDTAQMEFFGTTKSAAVSYNGTVLSFFTNGASFVQALNIDNTGNVGIGTATPGSQFVIANGASSSSINAGATQFTAVSSRTFKENIASVDVPDILTKIEAVPVVTYDFKNNGAKNRMGLIAEDFYTVLGRGDDKHIDGQDVQMALWMAVQKLTAENKALTDRLAKIEGSLAQKP